MFISYLIFCLLVATTMAEPPVFAGFQNNEHERVLSLNVHAGKPHIYQQLPPDYSFTDFLPPSASYGAPAASVNQHIKTADFEMPLDDSYMTAFLESSSQHHHTGYDHGPSDTQVHKHVYVHVPPKDFEEDEADQPRARHQTVPKQKHYKIIFIKAPETPSMRIAIAPPLPQNEEKTIIYVLHKKPETLDDIVIPTPEPTKPSKPEVYFIKYKNKRQEAPVYGPPAVNNEILSRQAEEKMNENDNFIPKNEEEFTTQQPQYGEKLEHQQSLPKLVTDESSVQEADSFHSPTLSSFVNENSSVTTIEPLNQYLPPPITTATPIVVKEMDESAHLPDSTYGAPSLNRFFVKRRK